MILIDGSLGEGGGQILRTSLALSMVTGQPFRITSIRAGRAKPGLLRQHLTAVNAAAAISSAALDGASIGSQSLTFSPGPVTPGNYTFSIGSAGSTTLVLQTILPARLLAGAPSVITLEGGTHNPHAPPFDFLDRAFLPLINRMGPTVTLSLDRAGFYPAGGGRFTAHVIPCTKLSPLHLLERGQSVRKLATASVAALPGAIAKRELEKVEQRLGWTGDQLQIRQLPSSQGPGNILTLEIQSEQITELFTGFGLKGVSAEAVAEQAITPVRNYLAANVPVGPHLADQLLLPLSLAGAGSFLTSLPTLHTTTNIAIIQRFLPVRLSVQTPARENCLIEISSP
ncbi:MAG TPA: RNA 3'-terminal phosphate cyclase [Tepidisphaeraceae bacterium]|nr:RNA 3'-terminal phosphate cyclase [Tepidisphaeraceae bacterium]